MNAYPIQPPPPNRKGKGCLIAIAIAFGALVLMGGCAAIVAGSAAKKTATSTIATPPPAAKSGSKSPKTSGSKVKYSGTCDLDLGTLNGNDYSLTSEVELENQGDSPVKVAVLVSWPQYGHDPIGDGKVVTIDPGTKTVRFAKHATQNQISLAQDYELKHEGTLVCTYKAFSR